MILRSRNSRWFVPSTLLALSALTPFGSAWAEPIHFRGPGGCLINSQGLRICEGQEVIGLSTKSRYQVEQLYSQGEAVLRHLHGFDRGRTLQSHIDRFAPRVAQLGFAQEGGLARGKSTGNIYTIQALFASQDVVVEYFEGFDRGRVTTAQLSRLALEVECFDHACKGDEAIGRSTGSQYEILNLFDDGNARVRHTAGFDRGRITSAHVDRLSVRISRGRPGGGIIRPGVPYGPGPIVVQPQPPVVVTPGPTPAPVAIDCRALAPQQCRVGMACMLNTCTTGMRCNPVEALGISRVLACPAPGRVRVRVR
jgi:hypothetical protein